MIKTKKPEWIMADIAVECPDAPSILVQQSLMRAVQEFSSTCMLEVWVDIPTQENVYHYPFERYLPKGYGVNSVSEVRFNDCCLDCVTDECGRTCESGYRLDDLKQITLVGYHPSDDPECPDSLRVKVVLRLERDACEIPCDMLDLFEKGLKDGALANLFKMKKRPWTDQGLAEYYDNQFQGEMASAKCLVGNDFKTEQQHMQPERLL